MVLNESKHIIGLNHLQGEYWIATIRRIPAPYIQGASLNHLQGEYWIATQGAVTSVR